MLLKRFSHLLLALALLAATTLTPFRKAALAQAKNGTAAAATASRDADLQSRLAAIEKSLEDARISSDFYGVLNWKKLFKSIEIKRMSKINDEDVFVVVKTPEKGNPVTDYVSAKSYLVLRRETIQTSNTSQINLPALQLPALQLLTAHYLFHSSAFM